MNANNDSKAAAFMETVYDELRSLAAYHVAKERKSHTLQPTALVHEAYLRMVRSHQIDFNDRNHFFAVAAQCMRRLLIDHARKRNAAKRSGLLNRVTLLDEEQPTVSVDVDPIALEDALQELERLNERQARVVELRFLTGLTIKETANLLGVSSGTVKNDWQFSRVWLRARLEVATSD